VCKRGRPDIRPAIAFLCTSEQDLNENDCSNLIRLLSYHKDTAAEVLIQEADNTQKCVGM